MSFEHPINDDLLISEGDREYARRVYGPLAEALIFPELAAIFVEADRRANQARPVVHRWGLASVVMVLLALFVASSAPFFEGMFGSDNRAIYVIVLCSGIIGIVGALSGFGLFSARIKAAWLENRMIAEMLRQLHYRIIIEHAGEIIRACEASESDPDAFGAYHQRRLAILDNFDHEVVRRKHFEFHRLMDAQGDTAHYPIRLPSPGDIGGTFAEKLFAAYQTLRLHRQRQFATYKISLDNHVFSNAAMFCVLALLGLHFIAAILALFSWSHAGASLGYVHLATVWVAIVALAFRAIEEGFKPRADIQRYQTYQATIEDLLVQYPSGTPAAKVGFMRVMERAAYDEMVFFLRCYERARFAM